MDPDSGWPKNIWIIRIRIRNTEVPPKKLKATIPRTIRSHTSSTLSAKRPNSLKFLLKKTKIEIGLRLLQTIFNNGEPKILFQEAPLGNCNNMSMKKKTTFQKRIPILTFSRWREIIKERFMWSTVHSAQILLSFRNAPSLHSLAD
jgi:hypothetical protein